MATLRCLLFALPLLAACHRPWLERHEPEAAVAPQAAQASSWSTPGSAGQAAGPLGTTPAGYLADSAVEGAPTSGESWRMPATQAAQAVTFARSVAGAPYCWAGVGPHCYDCSGLAFAAWWWAGKRIPRSSSAQHQELPEVPMDALQPGDIVWRPGHVGLYVGDGWVIHAPGSGKSVSYQRVDRYLEARRP